MTFVETREFLFDDGERQKFWEVTVREREVETGWGRVGTRGQRRSKVLASAADARTHADRIAAQKVHKGYVETPHARLRRVSEETRRAARKLVFVETMGGPVLVLPQELARDWNGTYDEAGNPIFEQKPCDYDRACARGIEVSALSVADGTALVMGSIGPVAWHPLPSGGLLVLWAACDTTAALLEVATSLPTSRFRKTRLRLRVGSSKVLLLDAARRGRSPGRRRPKLAHSDYRFAEAHLFSLAPGTYAVDDAGGVKSSVVDGDQRAQVSVEVVRLRRVS